MGNTVRRPASPSSGFVSSLLKHLEQAGFAGAPRYLGQDERGRDILSYIPGVVPEKFRHFDDKQVREAGKLLRAFHDATRASKLAGTKSVVCHHDPGPNNTVFHGGLPIAFIDFDFAEPGEPIEDLGYMAWSWCISSKPERGPASAQAKQVGTLADSYGASVAERGGLVDAILQRQAKNIRFWTARLDGFSGPPTSREEIQARIAWSEQELTYTRDHGETFMAAL
jgi:Ser/Thr protein kinase RdoA (MazF antagonist)